jgi:hypothetical protein
MSRIFISHSSANNDWAIRIRDWLVSEGWGLQDDIFLDLDPARGIKAGERWKATLQREAKRCELILALVSKDWLASQWCKAEVDAARLMGKRVLVALIGVDGSVLPQDITEEQWLDLTNDPRGLDKLAEALKSAGLDPSTFSFPEGRRPYPGLTALDVDDAAIFFGRDAQIVRGLDKIRGLSRACVERMLVILGASGAGKSSFMRAGLWPRLRRDDRTWLPLAIIRPERAVLSGTFGLAASLERTIAERHLSDFFLKQGLPLSRVAIQDFIEFSKDGLARLFAALRTAVNGGNNAVPLTIVLSIDQAEELFNEDAGPEANQLVDIILDTMGRDQHFLTLLAIRSDAFPRLQSDPQFASIPKDSFPLDIMLESSWRDVIEGPARIVRPKPLLVDPNLTEALLADTRGQDALPLLAFTLERLHTAYQADGRLTLAGYHRLGGMKGVIQAAVMDAISDGIRRGELPKTSEEQIALVRAAFIPHLARVNSAGEFIRRVASSDEISPRARPLLDRLIERRLLTRDRRLLRGTEVEVVEITHEAILREWKGLNDALTEEREFLIAKGQLEEAVNEWRSAPVDAKRDALLVGTKLARAQQWLRQRPDDLSDDEVSLVRASSDAETVAQRRKILVRRLAVAASVAASVMLSAIALYSYNQSINSKLSEILATLRVGEIQTASAKFRDLASLPGISFWSRTISAQNVATEILDSATAKEIAWSEDLDDFIGSYAQKRANFEEKYSGKISCAQTSDLCVLGKTDVRLDARGSRSSFHIGPRSFLNKLDLPDGKEISEKAKDALKVTSFFQPNPSRNLISISSDGSLVAISEDRVIHFWYVGDIEHQNQAPNKSITFDLDFDRLSFLPDTHDIVVTGNHEAAFLTLEPRRVRVGTENLGVYAIAPETDGLPPKPEAGQLSDRQLRLSYDKSRQELAYYGAQNGAIRITDKALASFLDRIDMAKTPNLFQIQSDLLAVPLDGTECRRAGHDKPDEDAVLADLLVMKLGKDRSVVERASLLVCGATFNHDWGDKTRLSVSVARPHVDTPIFLGGRQFGGIYEISRDGIPGRLFLLCDGERRAQEPTVTTHPDSQVATYLYQVYDSTCEGTTDLIYNATRGEVYSFGIPYNSPSGSVRITRLNLGSRITDLLPNTNKAFFDRVFWMAASNDGKLLASEKYESGLELFILDRAKKVALPREVTQPVSKSSEPRLFFGKTGEVWIARADDSILWAVPEADLSQFDFLNFTLQKTVEIDDRYTPAIGEYYIEQIRSLVDDEKIADAVRLRNRAVAKDTALQPRVDQQLAMFSFEKGVEALTSRKDDDAERNFAETLRLAPAMKLQIDAAWAKGLFDRGRGLFGDKHFIEAINTFQAASSRGYGEAGKWAWLSIMRRSDQLRESGSSLQALLMAMNGYLDLSPETRAHLELMDLKIQLQTITSSIFDIFRRDPTSTRIGKDTANQCDVLAAHPFDPFRTTAPARIDKMDAGAAIAACDKAIEENPKEGRFYFQRSRGHAKAATDNRRDKSVAEKHFAARRSDLGASMELSYPYAFVAQGNDQEEGFGATKDMKQAADYYLEAFNRAVICCVLAAANELMAVQQSNDFPLAPRAAHALVLWTAALGNVEARELLSRWNDTGELRSTKAVDDAKLTDLPYWVMPTANQDPR